MQADSGGQPIASVGELVDRMVTAAKPRARWAVGTEHEKFGIGPDGRPLPYDGPAGIERVLGELERRFAWEPVLERGRVIALLNNGASVTLEPGGQLELSGAALPTIHETCPEITQHLRELREISQPLGIRWLGIGFHPLAARDEFTWMPKERYEIMRRYMPTRGERGLDMMLRTCTVQANYDYGNEADAMAKLRAAIGLAPVVTAMFANSPFVEGRDSGMQSYRAWCWLDTDPDRSGIIDSVLQPDAGLKDYVEWVLDVPMYLLKREGRIIDMTGTPFRQFMNKGHDGKPATLDDWDLHLTTVFPDARVKTYLEVRSADAGSHAMNCVLPALWKGLLYDDDALAEAWSLAANWSGGERRELSVGAAREGLRTSLPGGNGTLLDVARELLTISSAGLERQRALDSKGRDERRWLSPLEDHIASGESPADRLLARWHGELGEDPAKLVDALVY